MESEIIATNKTLRIVLGMEGLRKAVLIEPSRKVGSLYTDNEPSMFFALNPVDRERSRHLRPKFYMIRRKLKKGKVTLLKCHTDRNVADIFTKALPVSTFENYRNGLMVRAASVVKP